VTVNLLTFGNVSGEAFDRAQMAAVNLSARLGQDLQSSAVQVGKALNDPIKGVTALGRVGVSFTEQQKEQIKAMTKVGDVAGAQSLILAQLEKQYGGSAEAPRGHAGRGHHRRQAGSSRKSSARWRWRFCPR
jgi:phage-related minor tail protein